MADEDSRWPAFLRRGQEPIFILNRRRQIIFVNPAWEALAGVAADAARGLACTRRASGHDLAHLARTLVPPGEAMQGHVASVRRPIPATATGPPWWDIDYLPIMGEQDVAVVIGRIRPLATELASPMVIPAAWAELRAKVQRSYTFSKWESTLPEMILAVAQARHIAETGCHAMLVGHSGTGKQTLARTIHAHSKRRELPFVALDCSRLPAEAVRGVLFGPRGLAHASAIGTLYVSDPASLPADLQAELASAVKNTPQLLIGCMADPRESLSTGSLHRNLFARAALVVVQLPTLQQRRDELARLCDEMLRSFAGSLGCAARTMTLSALAALREHPWPGNLDELSAILYAAARNHIAAPIDVPELPMKVRHGAAGPVVKSKIPQLDQTLEQVERRLIKLALAKAKGNKSKAADLLGVWRPRLLRRMDTLGMTNPSAEK